MKSYSAELLCARSVTQRLPTCNEPHPPTSGSDITADLQVVHNAEMAAFT